MAIKLHKLESYHYGSKLFQETFLLGKVYEVSPEVEKYLLNTGHFHYVPNGNKPIPKEIAKADLNIKLIQDGVIDGKGNKITNEPAKPLIVKKEQKKTFDLYLDDEGNEVIEEVVKKKASAKELDELDEVLTKPVKVNLQESIEEIEPQKQPPKVKRGRASKASRN